MYEALKELLENDKAKVCVMGIGYVGLPLLLGFAGSGLKVIGFDTNKHKIEQLAKGNDITRETRTLRGCLDDRDITLTSNPENIKKADFIIICVPTPVSKENEPDLSFVEDAGKIAGGNLKRGSIVILESTVYPCATEEILRPILERESKLVCGSGFSLGYSPERVNPGDSEHNISRVVKIVSGINKETTEILELLYKRIVKVGIHKTRDIKTAEAAKVIENIQRDLNIALVNELSIIFGKMDIDIIDVLKAAETKWNFHAYKPGPVGGHCIPVDPYYLVFKSKQLGYNPKVILSGREINDSIPILAAEKTMECIRDSINPKVLLLGLTFKKNVRDTRNSPVKVIISTLKKHGVRISAYEPLLEKSRTEREFGIEIIENFSSDLNDMDCVLTITDHDIFSKEITPEKMKKILKPEGTVIDIRRMFNAEKIREAGFRYATL